MAKPKCPDCKRDSTYNAKFDQCSACGRGDEKQTTTSAGRYVPEGPVVAGPATHIPSETGGVSAGPIESLSLVPGKPCPTCGKPVGKSKAQLQKEYRERKKK